MKIKEFIENRTCEQQAVQRYILRHPELFDGHAVRQGKELELDDVAVRFLEKKYPLAAPVQVVNGVPRREYDSLNAKYQRALEDGKRLAELYAVSQKELREKTEAVLLLESAEQKVAQLEEENKTLSDVADINFQEAEKAKKEAAELKKEIERLKRDNEALEKRTLADYLKGMFRRSKEKTNEKESVNRGTEEAD